MTANEGGTREPSSRRNGARALAIAYLCVFVLLIGFGTAVELFGNPHAHESVVHLRVITTTPRAAKAAAVPEAAPVFAPAPAAPVAPSVTRRATPVAPLYAGTALIADPALIEATDQGPLPRIAADGRTPMQAYAGQVGDPSKPRIAVVIGGLGISAEATATALANLPPQVTLAFAPYAADVQRWVTKARYLGHEVLLEVPMEPFDFPDSDAGQHTLRAGVAADANSERLKWALTRFTGYTGVTNLLGARLLSDSDSLEPVLSYLAQRGLLFFDNSVAGHSVAPAVASHTGTAFAQTNATIDSIQTAMEIDHALSELETEARARGFASGTGFIYPITVERVAQWAQGLGSRGFVLVPASAIVTTTKR